MNKNFVYVIFDKSTFEVFECYYSEEVCVASFYENYWAIPSADWRGINLSILLEDLDKIVG